MTNVQIAAIKVSNIAQALKAQGNTDGAKRAAATAAWLNSQKTK